MFIIETKGYGSKRYIYDILLQKYWYVYSSGIWQSGNLESVPGISSQILLAQLPRMPVCQIPEKKGA